MQDNVTKKVSQLSVACALTVRGGHSPAVVGKPGQCHIEVWDYLIKVLKEIVLST